MTNKRSVIPIWLKWTLISAVAVTVVAVSTMALLTMGALARGMTNMPLNPADTSEIDKLALLPVDEKEEPLIVELDELPITRVAIDASEAASIPTVEPVPTLSNDDRLTILLMGLDRRTGEKFISRTDTMMLVSVDPQDNDISLMSIPRDLYVEIPGYSRQRINTAFFLGGLYGGAGERSGAELAMQTIEENIGVQVDHYVLVDFDTVINIVDTFGGVTVEVPNPIIDNLYPDMNYGYEPLFIPAGTQLLDGETTLKYMRTRHGSTDFDRSQRQQQVMVAFRDQVLASGITGVARRIPNVYQTVKDGIFSDMSLDQLTSLIVTAASVDSSQINRGVLDYNYVSSFTSPRGESVLLLRTELVAELVRDLFE
ncbi:MAG: LCP family protein [Candidatus Promineifilaceae bacterium]